jgi:nitroreductase
MSQLTALLSWRYATKAYDPSRNVPVDKLERIIEAIRLIATSSGLQPFGLLVVTKPRSARRSRLAITAQSPVPIL